MAVLIQRPLMRKTASLQSMAAAARGLDVMDNANSNTEETKSPEQSKDPSFKAPLDLFAARSCFKKPSGPFLPIANPKAKEQSTNAKDDVPKASSADLAPPKSQESQVESPGSPCKDQSPSQPKKTAVQGSGSLASSPAYRPPAWAGAPAQPYALEVLRGGQMVEKVDLAEKSCVLFGRLPDCDVVLQHPSISRHHAALVYRPAAEGDSKPAGWYLYDLGSTHGTKLNKNSVEPRVYCRLRVGHMCRFGGSSRLFLLQGPEEDMESESELTVTELKAIGEERQRKLARLEQDAEVRRDEPAVPAEAPAKPTNVEEDGISWGMAEDADEASDLQFNPFALGEAEGEQLYLVDPKKTLRGWFEREGLELVYNTEDLPGARFTCKIDLPLDTPDGRPVTVEYSHQGKKKDAVFQCALEACRVLDRAGLLRQAKHEGHDKRKRKKTEYDSDEDDTFLDRTGAVEERRRRRREAAAAAAGKPASGSADTYQSLLEQHQRVQAEAAALERRLADSAPQPTAATAADGDDALDAFMSRLNSGDVGDRAERRRLKAQLTRLRSEEGRLCRLVNLARPASLPPLKPPPLAAAGRSPLTGLIGKRRGSWKTGAGTTRPLPARGPSRPDVPSTAPPGGVTVEDQAQQTNQLSGRIAEPCNGGSKRSSIQTGSGPAQHAPSNPTFERISGAVEEEIAVRSGTAAVASVPTAGQSPTPSPLSRLETADKDRGTETSIGGDRSPSGGNGLNPGSEVPPAELSAAGGDRTPSGGNGANPDCEGTPGEQSAAGEDMSMRTDSRADLGADDTAPPAGQTSEEPLSKKARRRRNKKAQHNTILEPDYASLASDDRYDVWVPPTGQTGDGRTSLNDKYGY